MVATDGLTGPRPTPETVERVTAPPYDVIRPGSQVERLLRQRRDSIYHVILGEDPVGSIARLLADGAVVEDTEPCYYVSEQRWPGGRRLGVFAAIETSDYATGRIRRHEKTFDDKVRGRIALAAETGLTLGPMFLLTRQNLDAVLERCLTERQALFDFASDFGGETDLHGLHTRVVRIPVTDHLGEAIHELLAADDLYIADGHHRYHAALRGGQTHCLGYVTGGARILAYNRVINGTRPFAEIKADLPLTEVEEFVTPRPHEFAIHHAGTDYLMPAREVPDDVVGKLDCSILERELYPLLGLDHSMIMDPARFDYFAEFELDTMRTLVDHGDYDLAVALHPVSVPELMAVADAGLDDPDIVMPEKSTFFSPKLLTGLIGYRHRLKG